MREKEKKSKRALGEVPYRTVFFLWERKERRKGEGGRKKKGGKT